MGPLQARFAPYSRPNTLADWAAKLHLWYHVDAHACPNLYRILPYSLDNLEFLGQRNNTKINMCTFCVADPEWSTEDHQKTPEWVCSTQEVPKVFHRTMVQSVKNCHAHRCQKNNTAEGHLPCTHWPKFNPWQSIWCPEPAKVITEWRTWNNSLTPLSVSPKTKTKKKIC